MLSTSRSWPHLGGPLPPPPRVGHVHIPPLLHLDLKMFTWNARALFFSHLASRARAVQRVSIFGNMCQQHHVIAIQETHGNPADVHALYSKVGTHTHYLSTIPGRAVGGISLSVNLDFLAQFEAHFVRERIPGRVLQLDADGPLGAVAFIAVHFDPNLSIAECRHQATIVRQAVQQGVHRIHPGGLQRPS